MKSLLFQGLDAQGKLLNTTYITRSWLKIANDFYGNYTIKVTNEKMWNFFTIRAQNCDWLYHCQDVIIADKYCSKSEKSFSFKLNQTTPAIFKLRFFIEYFSYDNVEFSLNYDYNGTFENYNQTAISLYSESSCSQVNIFSFLYYS